MIIRPLSEADQAAMLELLTNETIKQTYLLPNFEKPSDAIPLFRRLLALSRDEGHFVRGICAEDRLVGFLNDVSMEGGSVELGYVVHPAYQGRGYATAALKAAIAELFRMGFREVVAGAFSDNAASLRVMQKAGMTRSEKTEEIEYRGARHRCVCYSIAFEKESTGGMD